MNKILAFIDGYGTTSVLEGAAGYTVSVIGTCVCGFVGPDAETHYMATGEETGKTPGEHDARQGWEESGVCFMCAVVEIMCQFDWAMGCPDI